MIKAISMLLIPLLLISAKSCFLTTRSEEPVFLKKKSWPIYNRKYILKAQRNIESGNCDEDTNHQESELTDMAAANREIYRNMLLQQNAHKRSVKSSLIAQSKQQTNKKSNCSLNSKVTSPISADTENINREYGDVKKTADGNDINMQILHSLQSEINKLKQELHTAKEQLAKKNPEYSGSKHHGEARK